MNKYIIFDIETIGNIRDLSTMKITVISIYRYETGEYQSFEEHELKDLWPILEKCDGLIGYNSEHFDMPILNRYYTGDLTVLPHLDMLVAIRASLGKRLKLDDVAKATLNIQKSADGLIAMEWFKQGEIQKIKDYCEQDVKVTKELYEYGLANNMLYYPNITGEILPFQVDFSFPVNENAQKTGGEMNFTLPL